MIQKIIHRVILFCSLLGLFLIGSKIIAHYQTGAKHQSIFLTPVSLDKHVFDKTKWINNSLIENHPNIKYAITKDLNVAWQWLNNTVQHQTSTYLENYFHENMLDKIEHQLEEYHIPTNREVISHQFELLHLSIDKSVAVVKDHNCVIIQRDVVDDREINFTADTLSYTAILVFSDGVWKINNWISEENLMPKRNLGSTQIFNEKLESINSIRGINYYSQDHPWHFFWDSIKIETIKNDFQLIQDLSMNTVRVFIPFQTFNKKEKEKYYFNKLQGVLKTASEHNLEILVTLFDFPVGFSLDKFAEYNIHLERLVDSIKDHPSLLAWNVKNEPDLDFEHHGQQAVLDWLNFFVHRLRVLDPNHPITVSWSQMKYLPILAEKLDFLSFHMYIEGSNWQNTLQQYQSAYNKPIILEEFGLSTRSGLSNLLGKSEAHQLDYIRNVVSTAENNNVPWMLWTLYDFKQIPDGVFRSRPWILSKQSHFGLIRKDGSKKDIYHLLKEMLSQ